MGITVLQFEGRFADRLSLQLRAGRNGMSRVIKKLAVMETTDFVYGADTDGMFVLTTLSFVDDAGNGLEGVRALLNAGPAGIAVKTKRYVSVIPHEILELAEESGIPVFEICSNVRFSNFISLVTETLVIESYKGSDNWIGRHSKLLQKYMSNESLEGLLESLGEMLGISCFFINVHGRILGSYEVQKENSRRSNIALIGNRLLEMSLTLEKRKCCFYDGNTGVFPCRAGNNMLGVLILLDSGQLSEDSEDIVLQTMSYVTVRACEQHMSEADNMFAKGSSLLDEVLFQENKDSAVIRSRLRNGGFELLDNYVFIIVSIASENSEDYGPALAEYCQAQLARRFPKNIMKWNSGSIQCMVTFPHDDGLVQNGAMYDRLVAFWNSTLASNGNLIDVGVSLIQEDPADLTQSFLQAQSAITLGKIYRPEKHIYDYRSFLVQGIVFRCKETQEYKWLVRYVVEPISERDRLYESGLWDTLSVLFRVRSLKTAASELHIHISTLRYRLQKLKDVTGLDFLSAYGNYMLHTAYLIWMESKVS